MAGMHRDGKYYNNDWYRNRHTMRMMDDDRKYGMSKKMPTMMMDDMSTMDPMDMSMHDMSTMLEWKTGSWLERAFLEGMIPHHQWAVEMANYLTGNIKPELQKMRDEIINAQTKEIEMMKKWLVDWGYTSTGTTTLSSEDEMMREHCKTMPEMVGCEKYK